MSETHFKLTKLSKLAHIIDPHPSHRAPDEVTEGIPFAGIGDLTESGYLLPGRARIVDARILVEHSLRYKLTGNSIGFGRVATIGKIIDFPKKVRNIALSPTMAVIEPYNIDRDYLLAGLNSFVVRQKIEQWLTGSTRSSLGIELLRELPIPTPSPEVQIKIGGIYRNITTNIAKTQALIEKYQLIKSGLMHDLFTRGIGADGKLRPPRGEAPELYQETAIGWIPKEWELVQLGQYADICSGVTLGSKQQSDQNLKVSYLRVANVQDGYLDLSEVKEIMVNQKTLDALRLQKGDVLMNEGGDFDKLGRGTVWQGEIEPCIHQNHVFRVRVNKKLLLPNYLAFWSQSAFGKKYFVLSSKQSTNLASINSSQLHKFPIGLASINEQIVIEERVNAMNLKIYALECEGEKLRKQKAGLMHDLLTGKVQVKVDNEDSDKAIWHKYLLEKYL